MLNRQFEQQGYWLFRHRSVLPILILPCFIFAVLTFTYPEGMHSYDEAWEFFALAVAFLGMAVRIKTIGHTPANTSGRNTKDQRAAELNTTGFYSVVRHPLYLGNFLITLGVTLFLRNWVLLMAVTALFAFYYERIMYAEEHFLKQKFGARFEEWASGVPSIFPNFLLWKAPALPFSYRNVLKREYSTFFGIIAAFFGLEMAGDWVISSKVVWDPIWVTLFLAATSFYLIVRTVKKRTSLLHVPGR